MAEYEGLDKVVLDKPSPGEKSEHRIEEGHVYVFAFYLDVALFEAKDDDCLILFDDASELLLRNFFSTASSIRSFYLEMPDGILVSGKDAAEAMNLPLNDIKPGAGQALLDEDQESVLPAQSAETSEAMEAAHDAADSAIHSEPPLHYHHQRAADLPEDLLFPDESGNDALCSAYCMLPPSAPLIPESETTEDIFRSERLPPFVVNADMIDGPTPDATLIFFPPAGTGEALSLENLLDSSQSLPLEGIAISPAAPSEHNSAPSQPGPNSESTPPEHSNGNAAPSPLQATPSPTIFSDALSDVSSAEQDLFAYLQLLSS